MPSVEWNKYWDRYDWSRDGEEWDGQARYCGQPYEAWKAALLETFVRDELDPSKTVLEIAPGHGRWSEYLIAHAGRVFLVDLNPQCIEFCRERFGDRENVEYLVNDGRSLPGIADASIDFVWSYDSFVHIEREAIQSYFHELSRVLRPGGVAVIHHAGRRHSMLPLGFLRRLGPPGRWVYRVLSMKLDTAGGDDGDRSHVSRELVRRMAERAGLEVLAQTDSWGATGEFDCRRFDDAITRLRRPS